MSTASRKVQVSSAVEGLPAYVPGARPTHAAGGFKLSSNENPFPPLPGVLAAVADAAADLNRYPDMFAEDLTAALAERFDHDPAGVVTGAGSVAVLAHALGALCEPDGEVVHAWRSFEAYPILVQLAHARSVAVPCTPEGRHDLGAMARAVGPATRVVLLCSPNNPTGPAVGHRELEEFLEEIPSRVAVLLDEAYAEFVRDPKAARGVDLLADHPNLVLLRTFSKAYGLAGLRVGFALTRPRLAAAIRAASTPFEVNGPAQLAALASLRAENLLADRVEQLVARRDRLVAGLRAQGWAVPDSQGNFVWLDLGEKSATFARAAADAGILVRPFAGEGVRISVGEEDATDAVLAVTASWVR